METLKDFGQQSKSEGMKRFRKGKGEKGCNIHGRKRVKKF